MSKSGEKTPRRARRRSDVARLVGRMVRKKPSAGSLAGATGPDRHRFEAVMKAAERSGLLKQKTGRIASRVSPALVQEAKRRTGIIADTDLIAFALANVALEDNFAAAFKDARGKVDADLKLGF